MSKFCQTHIGERTDVELEEFMIRKRLFLNGTDPRTKEGKRAQRDLNRAKEVISKRSDSKNDSLE